MPYLVGAGNLESGKDSAFGLLHLFVPATVACLGKSSGGDYPEPRRHTGEADYHRVAGNLVRGKTGARGFQFFAIIGRQGQPGQALSHLLLAHRMDVFRLAQVYDAGHSAFVQRGGCHFLCFAKLGPAVVPGFFGNGLVTSQLGYVEGKVIAPQRTPVQDHGLHKVPVTVCFFRIGFSLIPDGALDGKRSQRLNHGIV